MSIIMGCRIECASFYVTSWEGQKITNMISVTSVADHEIACWFYVFVVILFMKFSMNSIIVSNLSKMNFGLAFNDQGFGRVESCQSMNESNIINWYE